MFMSYLLIVKSVRFCQSALLCRSMDTLQRHMPVAGQDGVDELLKIAWRFEEKIFQAATDQVSLSFQRPNLVLVCYTCYYFSLLVFKGAGPKCKMFPFEPVHRYVFFHVSFT